MPAADADLAPLLDAVLHTVPAPIGDPTAPLQALVTNLDASDYLGRLAIGRVVRGTLHADRPIALVHADGRRGRPQAGRSCSPSRAWAGCEVDRARAPATCSCSPASPRSRSATPSPIPADPDPLPRLTVDEPVLRMTLRRQHLAARRARTGKYLTVAATSASGWPARCSATSPSGSRTPSSPDVLQVAGRGELQLAVLIESMRREGYELEVSRPEVITREIDGKRHEPVEEGVVDVPDEHVGAVTQALAPRKGTVLDLRPGDPGPHDRQLRGAGPRPARLPVAAADRPRGARRCCTPATAAGRRGSASCPTAGAAPWSPTAPARSRPTPSTTCSCGASCSSARATQVYEGMVVGENARPGDMVVNVTTREAEDQHPHPRRRRRHQAHAAPRAHHRDGHRAHRRRRAGRDHAYRHPGAQAAARGARPPAVGEKFDK